MASSFLSDFMPPAALKRWLPSRAAKKPYKKLRLHLRNIYIVPTYAGLGLVVLLFLLLVAAINFQNSLIYIICFWLGSLLVINILYTFRNLAGLEIELLGAEACFAGGNSRINLQTKSPTTGKEAIYIGWKTTDLARLDLNTATSADIQLAYPAAKRGYMRPPRLDIFTRYPTGLTVAWAYADFDIKAIVYPAPKLINKLTNASSGHDEADDGTEIPGGTSDFSGIRAYQPGDSPRRIHWAKYAQTGKLYSKVFVDYANHDLWLDWADLPSGSIEQRLSHLCALILDYHQEQKSYGLRIPGSSISPSHGEAHRNSCLNALALFPNKL